MKVIKNTLQAYMETWQDPGVYPSNAGAGPLPDHHYMVGEGELILEAETQDDANLFSFDDELVEEYVNLPNANVTKWKSEIKGNRIILSIEECEGLPDERDYDYDREE